MKAAQINSYGGEESITVVEGLDKPTIGNDQVLVEVHAAGVNPFDVKVRDGLVRQMAELEFPAILGGDLAGVIVEVGSSVNGFTVGQAVYGQAGALSSHGSFAEYAPANAAQLANKPDSIDFVTAAALPLAAISAYQALVEHANLQPGQKVLIHGGAGGIGTIAIQLAKHLGAYVATTAGSNEVDMLKSLGADQVIDYKNQDFTNVHKDFDAVFDTVGGETNRNSYQVLKAGGSLVSMVEQPDKDLIKRYGVVYAAQFTQVTTDRLNHLSDLIDKGSIKPIIDKAFTLNETAKAMEYLKTGHPKGKVVIKVRD